MVPSKVSEASAGLPVRQGAPPTVTRGVPHIQLDQTSDDGMYRRSVARASADARITEAPSRASLCGALALTVAAGRAVRQESMIVDREFAHIHRQPGTGSLHLKLPASEAADVVAKGWGEWHPFALSGSAPAW